ncbi:chitinase domain-containing protein 1 [Agrilus planipennis]|uniref:Chitinase domain-containing protein 1 n=1 Tax=Agrilus planipennis TaxID=224129 RepID=A0A7F5R7C0_AGRPL|nr:chitinase domain-containing protein 1 [Agrilus planipennis]
MFLNNLIKCTFCLLALINAISVNGTLSPKSPKSKKGKHSVDKVHSGPQNQNVKDKNLITQTVKIADILSNYQAFFKEVDAYSFDGLVLGYVTPWNNHGYDVAKIFGNKFTHISPVWLQVRCIKPAQYEITGTHDVDKQWILDVKNAGKERGVKVVPRILFDKWSLKDFQQLLGNYNEMYALTAAIVESCKKYNFDGVVLEVWSQITNRFDDSLLVDLIKHIGKKFSSEQLDLFLVVPPKRGMQEEMFTGKNFDDLYDYVTGFSLMTYDFSNPQRPGPNAPLPWVKDCIQFLSSSQEKRKKILTGLNFYGNAYTPNGGSPIVAHDYVELLKNSRTKELKFDPESVEHFFEAKTDSGRSIVFYPTLHSINERINLARKYGTGISIWELGQGLDYFYDLL